MTPLIRAAVGLLAVIALAGCASSKVTSQQPYAGGPLPRPDRIIVHDFGSTPGNVQAEGGVASEAAPPAAQTAEEAELGRKLGTEVAVQLVANLRGMGLPGVRAAEEPPPQPGDIVIKGNLYSVEEGSKGKRVLLGFGSGAAELKVAAEGYLMTPEGLRRLGGGSGETGGSKGPGMLAPLAIFAATKNPLGLVVTGALKARGERSGSSTIEGAAKRVADQIAARLQTAAKKQGWI
jgi:hypothetical protein